MADRASAVRQMQGALRSAPYYDGTGLWSTFAFEWRNWCPLAWIGGNADHITPVEKKRILVTRIRGQAVARLKAYGEGSTAWTDAPTLEQSSRVSIRLFPIPLTAGVVCEMEGVMNC